MRFDMLTLSCFRNIAVTTAMLLVMPASVVSAAPADSGWMDYDIPISELNKVKKKTATKHVTNNSKKKDINDTKLQETPSDTAAPTDPAVQAKTPLVKSNNAAQSGTTQPVSPAVSEPLIKSENIRIHHTPYSFVVTGKRTVILAVIDSKDDIKEVNCTLRSVEGGAETLVKMEKVSGTRFTYTAALPGVSLENHSLGYSIVVVDSLGKVTRSEEFVSPVISSPLVPSWQSESADVGISVELENAKKSKKDLSDPQ